MQKHDRTVQPENKFVKVPYPLHKSFHQVTATFHLGRVDLLDSLTRNLFFTRIITCCFSSNRTFSTNATNEKRYKCFGDLLTLTQWRSCIQYTSLPLYYRVRHLETIASVLYEVEIAFKFPLDISITKWNSQPWNGHSHLIQHTTNLVRQPCISSKLQSSP
jgi:hypothetical protein